jgi:hypothetical protein
MQSGIVPFSAKSKVAGGDKNIAVHYSENENCLSREWRRCDASSRIFIESSNTTAGSHLQNNKPSGVELPALN